MQSNNFFYMFLPRFTFLQKRASWMLAYLVFNLIIFGALLMYYIVFIASFFVDIKLSDYMGTNESRFSWVILIMLFPATSQFKLVFNGFFFQQKVVLYFV